MSDEVAALRAAMAACGVKTKHRHKPIEYSWGAESQPADHLLSPAELLAAADKKLIRNLWEKSQRRLYDICNGCRIVEWKSPEGKTFKAEGGDEYSVDIRSVTLALTWWANEGDRVHG